MNLCEGQAWVELNSNTYYLKEIHTVTKVVRSRSHPPPPPPPRPDCFSTGFKIRKKYSGAFWCYGLFLVQLKMLFVCWHVTFCDIGLFVNQSPTTRVSYCWTRGFNAVQAKFNDSCSPYNIQWNIENVISLFNKIKNCRISQTISTPKCA